MLFHPHFRRSFLHRRAFGFGMATVRFAALATLRTLPREADFALESFPRLRTFDPCLLLATIAPGLVGAPPLIDARLNATGSNSYRAISIERRSLRATGFKKPLRG